MIFSPRRLRPGDIVRTEDRKRFQRVYSVSKDFVVLENDEKQNQRYFFSVYPIKLQDSKAMQALGVDVRRQYNSDHNCVLRIYKIIRGDFVVTMREREMGYFDIEIEDRMHIRVKEAVVTRYYFHEVQQYFYEKTSTELSINFPEKLDFELETVHYWNKDGESLLV